jgi:hypothetical protein
MASTGKQAASAQATGVLVSFNSKAGSNNSVAEMPTDGVGIGLALI